MPHIPQWKVCLAYSVEYHTIRMEAIKKLQRFVKQKVGI